MDRDEALDIFVRLDKVHDGLDLRLGVSTGPVVSLRAGIAAGTSAYIASKKRNPITKVFQRVGTFLKT